MSNPETPPPLPVKPVILKEPKAPAPLFPDRTPSNIPAARSESGAGSAGEDIPEKWRGLFKAGEKIVWQGRGRSGAVQVKRVSRGGMTSAIVMIAFSLFWMGIASRGGGFIWAFGLIFLYKGLTSLKEALGGRITKEVAAQGAHYTLTNKAAYIGHYKGDLERIEITPAMRITLHGDSVLFAVKRGRTDKPYGFENIDNAADIYAMMRGIERGAR